VPGPQTANRDAYTTGQVARMLGVCARSASDLIDSGALPGYRLPTRGRDRRVTRAALLAFMREHAMPVPAGLERPGRRVLLVGCGLVLLRRLEALAGDALAVTGAATAFCAGRRFAECRPDAVVLDLALGRSECLAMAAAMRAAGGPRLTLLALAYEDEVDTAGLAAAGFTGVLFQPVDPAALAKRLAGGSGS
jgi:excisionase family DNA binding protein